MEGLSGSQRPAPALAGGLRPSAAERSPRQEWDPSSQARASAVTLRSCVTPGTQRSRAVAAHTVKWLAGCEGSVLRRPSRTGLAGGCGLRASHQ